MRTLYYLFFISIIFFPFSSHGVPTNIKAAVKKYCRGLDAPIVLGILKQENNFQNLNRMERDGIRSMGVMQVRFPTAKFMNCSVKKEKDLMEINANIECGCSYLRYQKYRYNGDKARMIASYNVGSAIKCKHGKTCRLGRFINQRYVDNVFKYAQGFRNDNTWN